MDLYVGSEGLRSLVVECWFFLVGEFDWLVWCLVLVVDLVVLGEGGVEGGYFFEICVLEDLGIVFGIKEWYVFGNSSFC